jgi:acid phosphatase type 7
MILLVGAQLMAVPPAASPAAGDPVLVGAGDIASCSSAGDEATAALLDQVVSQEPDATVFTTGDNVYNSGTASEYANCYEPSWGRHKVRTRPAPGNHDYRTSGAAGYYGYFGAAAGDPARGYYEYAKGAWHVIVLNSSCSGAGGCGTGSPQEQWLRAVLTGSTSPCTVAIWHHPVFSSSSEHGSTSRLRPFWEALYEFGADVVLAGHDHVYERFAPQTATGAADPNFGIRQFTVGTGGRSHDGFGSPLPNSEVRNNDTTGVLKLTLGAGGYDWQFLPGAGGTFTDSGTGICHGSPPAAG